jgi:hypothetical protein
MSGNYIDGISVLREQHCQKLDRALVRVADQIHLRTRGHKLHPRLPLNRIAVLGRERIP